MKTSLAIEDARVQNNFRLRQMQSVMAQIQAEFSLNAQIENSFNAIVEKLKTVASYPIIGAETFIDIYTRDFPPDLIPHCQLWYFTKSGRKFHPEEHPPLSSHRKGAMAKVFNSLVELSDADCSESKRKSGERFISGVFGEDSAPWYLATERCGRLTPIISESSQHYLFWEKFAVDDQCCGGFLAIFPGNVAENNRYALHRLAKKIMRDSSAAVLPVFLCSAKLHKIYSPVVLDEIKQSDSSIKAIRHGIRKFWNATEEFKPRTLYSINNVWFYYDSIADESPYHALLCSSTTQRSEINPFFLPGCIAGAIYLWVTLFWFRLRNGRFSLGFAFRLLFFLTAMLPILLLAFLGIRFIDQLRETNIRTRIQNGFAKLASIDEKADGMTSLATKLIKDTFNDNTLQANFISDSHDFNQRGFEALSQRLKQEDISLSYLFLMKPGKLSECFTTSYRERTVARHHLDFFALTCNLFHQTITRNQSNSLPLLLTPGQKVLGKSFNQKEGKNLYLFSTSLESTVTREDAGSEKALCLSYILGNNGSIQGYVSLGFHIDRAIERVMAEEFGDFSAETSDLFLGFNRDLSVNRMINANANTRLLTSSKGQRFLRFIKSASHSKFQMEVFDENEVFIYDPLLKAKSLFAGAMIGILDINQECDLKTLWLFTVLTLLAGIIYLLAAWISRTMLEPIIDLSAVFTKVAEGNYSQSFDYDYENELGLLSKATNLMTNGLKQRKLLGKFVSRTFDREVIERSSSTDAQKLSGVILFSDIRSFTTISEAHPPEETGIMLNNHLQALVKEIQQYDGQIEQFIGDAIVAFFPGEGEQVCRKSLAAAVAMMYRHQQIIAERQQKGQITYDIGIGLDYGLVMAGTLISGSRSEFSVVGPARVRAEEFESATKNGCYTRIIAGNSLVESLSLNHYQFCQHNELCYELKSLEKHL
ncbi:MAG: adenylate/guanylate cyclase domain-containing protein [Candidatus Riflebacteria bacterium]|nr:adenylate/guanylate cyclase domain-containing protein [Candidatus Riflebacteria bacterium]